jgi:hypothetical protein
MKGCRPSSSTPRRFANVLSKKHRVKKKHCHRRVAEHELNRASQQQQLRRMESRTSAIIGYCLKLPGRTCVPGTFLTLQEEPGTVVPGDGTPFKATAVPGRLEMVESNPSISVAKVRRK